MEEYSLHMFQILGLYRMNEKNYYEVQSIQYNEDDSSKRKNIFKE